MFKQAVSYDDVLLVPKFSDIESRKEVCIAQWLEYKKISLRIPIISAPMDTVTGRDMAISIAKSGGLGIIHRYCSIEEQVLMLSEFCGAAVGATGNFVERAIELKNAGCKVICIDVAHGHHILVKNALSKLRQSLGDDVHIMAGNIATAQGFRDLAEWGANSVKVGIGGGSICTTRIQTGHGIPTLQSVIDVALQRKSSKFSKNVKIIADGGIKKSGDIVKALAAGADFVMLGSMLAGCVESPGKILGDVKSYRGMASEEAQMEWKGSFSSREGVSATVPMVGAVDDVMTKLYNGIVSGLSYSGARNIVELQHEAEFIRQSGAGIVESAAHIFDL